MQFYNSRITRSKKSRYAQLHPLHDFVRVGDLKEGADVGTRDDRGSTPLHIATKHGHEEIFKFLLNVKSSNVNKLLEKVDRYDKTPLHEAPIV